MFRAVVSAVITSAALLGAVGVQAQSSGYYVATPAAKPMKDRLITRATPWQFRNGAFVAARAPERDLVLCQLVARDVGALSGFSVGGKAYDAAQLEKCNGKAAPVATAAAN